MKTIGSTGGPYRDTVTLPSILVIPGDPWPSEFYARYPHAFRVPVRIVWREGTSGRDNGTSPRLFPPPATAQPHATDSARGEAPPAETPAPAVAAVEGAYFGQGKPVGSFLRVNDFLDRLMGNPEPGLEGARGKDEGKPQDPNAPVPFVDDQGKPVPGPDGKQMMRPAEFDPHFFVRKGEEDGHIIKPLLFAGPAGVLIAGEYAKREFENFRQGGPWDAQRIGPVFQHQYIDFASVAIGLYFAAAGIPQSLCLKIQNEYAKDHSRYEKGTGFDKKLSYLPEQNIKSTQHGYEFYHSGLVSRRANSQ